MGYRTIKAGTYELRITDVTAGLKPSMKAKNQKILIKFADLDEEAAIAAAAVAAEKEKKGPGGKKKWTWRSPLSTASEHEWLLIINYKWLIAPPNYDPPQAIKTHKKA